MVFYPLGDPPEEGLRRPEGRAEHACPRRHFAAIGGAALRGGVRVPELLHSRLLLGPAGVGLRLELAQRVGRRLVGLFQDGPHPVRQLVHELGEERVAHWLLQLEHLAAAAALFEGRDKLLEEGEDIFLRVRLGPGAEGTLFAEPVPELLS